MPKQNKIAFYVSDKNKKPDVMIFMLHGCGGNAGDILKLAPMIKEKAGEVNFVAVAPQATMISVESNKGYQWFDIENNYSKSLFEKSPKNLNEEDNLAFNKMVYGSKEKQGLFSVSDDLNKILDDCQKKWGLSDFRTIILGYSQGAMMAIDVAISRKGKVKQVIAISGGVIPPFEDVLKDRIKSKPEILLIHGTNDKVISFNSAKTAKNILKKLGCNTKISALLEHEHGRKDKEFWQKVVQKASQTINKKEQKLVLLRGAR